MCGVFFTWYEAYVPVWRKSKLSSRSFVHTDQTVVLACCRGGRTFGVPGTRVGGGAAALCASR